MGSKRKWNLKNLGNWVGYSPKTKKSKIDENKENTPIYPETSKNASGPLNDASASSFHSKHCPHTFSLPHTPIEASQAPEPAATDWQRKTRASAAESDVEGPLDFQPPPLAHPPEEDIEDGWLDDSDDEGVGCGDEPFDHEDDEDIDEPNLNADARDDESGEGVESEHSNVPLSLPADDENENRHDIIANEDSSYNPDTHHKPKYAGTWIPAPDLDAVSHSVGFH
ncbi:hypothetical protein PC9H_009336 [Pleurotus ostreatus]|uniref:Uncharacterized protein n=1 Tax=Pleurotus ostreatus TaxID=5322 RepID=A0A8H6ZQH6_PLEOS|nr:uncharacterized protein PC9H_009336 [Pleurotus ostreatus]KAF7424036.1 hypothetical protein PC9H_009336 [Pleurotus ostreatus]KAJ8693148.1 hypothetical protein PTI98_010390 [Pleurotus ostreatus]